MKKLLLIGAIISFFTCQMQAQQEKYPKGIYMSFEEIVNKTPSKQTDLQVIKRSKMDIKMVGGNDYKPETNDKSKSALCQKSM